MIEKQRKPNKNFRKTSGKFPKFRKFAKTFPGNFPGNFPENSRKTHCVFLCKTQCYRAKIYVFIIVKVKENQGKLHGKFCGKFPKW